MKYLTICLVVLFWVGCGDDAADDGCTGGAEVCQVFSLVNSERAELGLSGLAWNEHLANAAQLHARDMSDNNYFDHLSQDGRTFSDRVEETEYDGFATAENIATGQSNADGVMGSWMKSVGHKRNILDNSYKNVGVGHFAGYWVQVFGR